MPHYVLYGINVVVFPSIYPDMDYCQNKAQSQQSETQIYNLQRTVIWDRASQDIRPYIIILDPCTPSCLIMFYTMFFLYYSGMVCCHSRDQSLPSETQIYNLQIIVIMTWLAKISVLTTLYHCVPSCFIMFNMELMWLFFLLFIQTWIITRTRPSHCHQKSRCTIFRS